MATYLGKNYSFGLPRVPFVNCCQLMYLVVSVFGFESRMWDLIVSVPDHCLSFYFTKYLTNIIDEPKYKYGQQEQVTVRNHNRSTALERSV